MNEIKKIHLDRQPFTISIEAHRALRAYLEAIGHQVGSKGEDVLKEIELRMAELLTERGITADKVILEEDVEFLKEQLGKPGDFRDEAHDTEDNTSHAGNDEQGRRLYRDTENAMIAGVASGLAAYFRIDPLIVRLIFVVLMFTGGAGIFAYILLWILVPEAKTPSDKLQMRGKAVTVDNIKRAVDRANVPAAANRAGTLAGAILAGIGKVFLAVIGAGFVTAGMMAIVWSVITSIYLLIHGGQAGTEVVFPVGAREVILLVAGLITAAMVGLMLTLAGIAMITRKWKVPTWATASIIGLFFAGASVGAALAFDTYPSVRQRWRDAHKVQTRSLNTFKNVELLGEDTRYLFKPSDTYSVSISHMGKVDDKNVATRIEGDTLKIDTSGFAAQRFCSGLCFYNDKDLEITIHAPAVDRVTLDGSDSSFTSKEMLRQDNLIIEAKGGGQIKVDYANPEEARLSLKDRSMNYRTLELFGIRSSQASGADEIFIGEESATVSRADRLSVETPRTCDSSNPIFHLNNMPHELRINGNDVVKSSDVLEQLRNRDQSNDYNCVHVSPKY